MGQVSQQIIELVQYAYNQSRYYQNLEIKNWLSSESKSIENLPFTTKEDLANRNEEFLCVQTSEIREVVTTSGTTGAPVPIYLSEQDLERLATNECNAMQIAGCTSADRFQLMTTMNKQFLAGLAYSLGVRKLEASMIRMGPGSIAAQWDSILKFEPTVLIAVPSFIAKMLEFASDKGIDPNKSTVQKIICIGEPIREENLEYNSLGKMISNKWEDVGLFSTYASTEMATAFTECEIGHGGHLQEDLIHLEVITEDGKNASDGEIGEVVVTTLKMEAMPLIRFRTGDVCHVFYEQCKCGRTSPRLGPVLTRKEHRIKVKGTTVYPKAIQNVVDSITDIKDYVVVVSKDKLDQDDVLIKMCVEGPGDQKQIAEIQESMNSGLRFSPRIELLSKDEIIALKFSEHKRKPMTFIDLRS